MRLWGTAELAKATGVTQKYITILAQQGKIKANKIGNRYIIADSEAQRWLTHRRDVAPKRMSQKEKLKAL